MNERIRELTEQARKYARDYVAECKHYGHYMEHNEYDLRFEEKFAEFIIQDILTVVKSEHKLALEFQWDADDTAIAIRDAIKKRFGVEE